MNDFVIKDRFRGIKRATAEDIQNELFRQMGALL